MAGQFRRLHWILLSAALVFLGSDQAAAQELTTAHREGFATCKKLQEQGKWTEAREIAQRLTAAFAQAPPSQHRLAFTNELANLDQRLGFYREASQGYLISLELAESLGGPETKLVSQLKNNLAALKQITGEFEEAEALNREALAIREKLEGENTIGTVPAMNNLAGLLWCIGDLDGAETLYRKGLTIRSRELGDEALDTARSMANLGGLLFYQNQIAEASTFVQKAADIFIEQTGPDHPETLEVLIFRGEIARASGNPDEALDLYNQVLSGRIKVFGENPHVETAEALRRVGDAERELGNYHRAITSYEQSDQAYFRILQPNHPDRLEGLYGAGLAALADGQTEIALRQAKLCSEIEFANLEAVLAFTDERQRLAYQNLFQSQHLFASLGEARAVAEFLLRKKGVVVDSLIAEARLMRRADTSEASEAVEILTSARARFRSAFLSGGESGTNAREAEAAVREAHRVLVELTGASALTSDPLSLRLTDLQAALPAGETLIDFLPFDHYIGNADFESRYGAAIVTRDSVSFVDCAPANEIDLLITKIVPFFEGLGQLNDADAKSLLQTLHENLMQPILTVLPESETLHICPDGPLNFIPFACLVDPEGRFLIERFDLGYVSAARELIRPPSAAPANREALLVGNPGFDLEGREVAKIGTHRGMLSSLGTSSLLFVAESLKPLEGAQKEVAELGLVLEGNNLSTRVITGNQATESTLKSSVNQPQLLHLATHGIYLPSLSPPPEETRTDSSFVPNEVAGFQNPLFGSWLALSGARNTVEAWSQGLIPDPSEDGILMANEAAELNLEGTLLVTLSACDTASGEATNGDGVLGIRRGFRMAGADNILTTLWPINDAMTVTIMREFYEGLSTQTPAQSLSTTQRKWLVTIRDNPDAVELPAVDGGFVSAGGFAWAINLAGPFLLSR